jgi:hypothetical protein
MTMPPSGRARKPMPNAAKVESSAAMSSPAGKKRLAIIVATKA